MAEYTYRLYRKIFDFHLRLIWTLKLPWRRKAHAATRTTPRITLLISFHNEISQLPGFFENILPHVDRIIGLDDGSTDGSFEFFGSQPKVASLIRNPPCRPHIWDEPRNRRLLFREALKYAEDEWVLVLDADERLGRMFRQQATQAINLAKQYGFTVLGLRLAELWNEPNQYRMDGIWGKKRRGRLFLLRGNHQVHVDKFHAPHYSSTINHLKDIAPVDVYIYHLGMLTRSQRENRRDKYKQLDPGNQWQSIGYDYLTDESSLRLKRIKKKNMWQ